MSKFLAAELRQLIAENRQLEQRFQELQRTIAAIRGDLEASSGEQAGLVRPRRRRPLVKPGPGGKGPRQAVPAG